MIKIIGGIRYDTNECEKICSVGEWGYNNRSSEYLETIYRTRDGKLMLEVYYYNFEGLIMLSNNMLIAWFEENWQGIGEEDFEGFLEKLVYKNKTSIHNHH